METSLTETGLRQLAQDAYDTLGVGHEEAVYQKALLVELRLAGLSCDTERVVPIMYRGCFVGHGRADIVVHSYPEAVVELKAQYGGIGPKEGAQVRKYLTGLGLHLGYVLNFPQPGSSTQRQLDEVELLAVWA